MTNPRPSSTSSSELGPRSPAAILAWTLVFCVAFDVGINVAFPYPEDTNVEPPTRLQSLFESGRSVVGKHRRMDAMDPAPWWLEGNWIGSLEVDLHRGEARPSILMLGNSFVRRTTIRMIEEAPELEVRSIIATSSPCSHALGAYRRMRHELDADVVVMGVLASTWPLLGSFCNASFEFWSPEAYTYPVYRLDGDQLIELEPEVATRADLRACFDDPERLAAWIDQLRAHDQRYVRWIYDETWLDCSAFVRLARRGAGTRHHRDVIDSFDPRTSYDDELLGAILAEFATLVRADGRRPIVVLFHDLGYGQTLYDAVAPTLGRLELPFVSSHLLIDANEPTSFKPEDQHYVDAGDREIARAILDLARAP